MKKIYQTPRVECNHLDIQEMILAVSGTLPEISDNESDTGQTNLSNKEIWGDGLW